MTDQDQSVPVTLSREQLYDLVGATPLHRLAKQYGITSTGLAKICARLDVPCPPRGYASNWMRSKVGVIKGEIPERTLDIRTLRKDIKPAVATGALTGAPMPLSAGTLASLSSAVANGACSGDLAELPKFLRDKIVLRLK